MEPLSSFGISLAAGIALEIYKTENSNLNKELKSSFNKALQKWDPNNVVTVQIKNRIKRQVKEIISSPELIEEIKNQNDELSKIFLIFEEVLPEFNVAYDYVKSVNDLKQFQRVANKLDSLEELSICTNEMVQAIYEEQILKKNNNLEKEWLRQISVYKESLLKLKPKTAYEYIVKLEKSFEINNFEPNNTIKSSIELLKGQCLGLIGKGQEAYECYIKAYLLNKEKASIKLLEKACVAYLKSNLLENSIVLADEIIIKDEHNATAWLIKVCSNNDSSLERILSIVPGNVLQDNTFKRILYYHTLPNTKYIDRFEVYEKYSVLPDTASYEFESLTYNNFNNQVFLIEVAIQFFIQSAPLGFDKLFMGDYGLLQQTNKVLGHFMNELSDSEILENFRIVEFLFLFTEFALNENASYVDKMLAVFNQLETELAPLPFYMTNSLQLIGRYEDAIKILQNQSNRTSDSLQLEAVCYRKLGDIKRYSELTRKYLKTIQQIDLIVCEAILNIQFVLNASGELENFGLSDFTAAKKYMYPYLKVLIEAYYKALRKENKSEILKTLEEIEDVSIKTDKKLSFYIAHTYFILEEFSYSSKFLKRYLEIKESRELYYYILSLEKSLSNHEELLELLQTWRTNFFFSGELLDIEANICRQIPDWKRCLEISEFVLSKNSSEESYLTLKLISINELNESDKKAKIRELAEIFKSFKFQDYVYAQNVARIMSENGYYLIALEALFQHAINVSNKQARRDYFWAISQLPLGIIGEKEIVEPDAYIKYELNKEIKFHKIQKEDSFSKKLLGHRTGDIISVDRPITKVIDRIKIIRIMDKYLNLHDKILEEAHNDPHSGLGMQSFKFEDNSPDGIKNTLTSLFGGDGTLVKQNKEAAFKKYYNYNISFSEIVLQNFNSDYIGGYYFLVNNKEGFTITPRFYFPELNINTEKRKYLLDFSTIPILYQIDNELHIEFDSKFLISIGTKEYYKNYLKREKKEKAKERMSVEVLHDKVFRHIITVDDTEKNIHFIESVLNWIDKNCIEVSSSKKLDYTRKLGNDNKENQGLFNLIIENISIVTESSSRILLTDDSIYYKFSPIANGVVISSELFLKSHQSNILSTDDVFIKNRYIGFEMTSESLITEYKKMLKNQSNFYSHCLGNISLRLIPNQRTIETAITFLKNISLENLIPEESYILECSKVLVNLLSGQRDLEFYILTEKIIRKEFRLMGLKLNTMLKCLKDAKSIIDRA